MVLLIGLSLVLLASHACDCAFRNLRDKAAHAIVAPDPPSN